MPEGTEAEQGNASAPTMRPPAAGPSRRPMKDSQWTPPVPGGERTHEGHAIALPLIQRREQDRVERHRLKWLMLQQIQILRNH